MAVYCSNCGSKNTDDVVRCVSCDQEIRQRPTAITGKFKGTMLIAQPQAKPSEPVNVPAPAGSDLKKAAHGTMFMGSLPVPTPPATSGPRTPPSTPSAPAPSPSAIAASRPSAHPASSPTPGPVVTSSDWPRDSNASLAPAPKPSGPIVWVLIALTALAVSGGLIAGIFAWKAIRDGKKAEAAFSQRLEAETGRLRIGIALSAIRQECSAGDCQNAANYLHTSAREQLLSQAHTISERAWNVLLTPSLSEVRLLSETDDQKIAQAANLKADRCVRVSSGSAKVIGCARAEDQDQFQILHMEGLSSLAR